ncbi:hypothetical protein TSUD_240000 [Trifolium subterraneum]|uniref:Helicase ATP-binding domain-containing protein n=1 Tax=Trifolium subterraneum TaxID=3900 RepID=A0A2Z6PCL8_TRISU|nr:hypothetical protein TSUD_240000 [Trifolium subterraneum]
MATTNTHLILSSLQPRHHHSFSLLQTTFSFSLLRFPLSSSFNSPTSSLRTAISLKPNSSLSGHPDEDDDDEEEEEDEEDEDDEDEDDDEDIAADEYEDVVSGEASDEDEVRQAIEAFLRGSSVVVSAPTSSGKTLIAEAAAVATVARGRRLFYTTPLKALSNQNVGTFSSGRGLVDVDVIVLDEVHYLSDISRGTVWEEVVIYCPNKVQLICLSATVANPDELAGWIGQIHGGTELVTTSKRPVPLNWHFSLKNFLLPLLDEKGTQMNRKLSLKYLQLQAAIPYKNDWPRKRISRRRGPRTSYDGDDSMMEERSLSKHDINAIRRSQVPQIIDTLLHLQSRDMLPAVWFIFSRKGCDAAVQYVEDCKLLDECEASEVQLALKKFRIQYPDAVRETAVKGLLQGVAAHHAGCLPLWKAFIEELFNRGLLKVVFATETLAAGINMPARTAVISSISKIGDSGRTLLTSNELLQMAGRAGRRGIDESGHVVLVQTPYEGAEECCKLLFSGLEPLVSQFTASYGMVLNLLGGGKAIRRSNTSDETKLSSGKTLDEARKLIEQSFGNYVSSSVMVAAKEEINRIEKEIQLLMSEITDEAIDRKSRKVLPQHQYKEIAELQEDLRAAKRVRAELRKQREAERISALKPLLEESENEHLPFLCLQYRDSEGVQHSIPAVFLGKVNSLGASKLKNMINSVGSFALNSADADSELNEDRLPSYHVALGSDNSWYLFTEKWIKTVYETGLPDVPLVQGETRPREIMSGLLDKEDMKWDNLAQSEHGGLWFTEGALETWSWSLNVPVLSSFSENDEVLLKSQTYRDASERYREQRKKVARLKKNISRTEGYREYNKILDAVKFTEEKIKRMRTRSKRLTDRIEQIEPSGWKEFMNICNVIRETRALDINTHFVFPLGETASAIRGENELWLAMVLRSKILLELKPAQLAAVCAGLVSEGIKVRPSNNNNYIYEPSSTVLNVIELLEEQRSALLAVQEKHGVTISCCLDSQFCGMVEAWASGLTWKEIMMECAMDDGDLSRLLRRTIDILVQIPNLPDIDPFLQRNARAASNVMDRPPISELAG